MNTCTLCTPVGGACPAVPPAAVTPSVLGRGVVLLAVAAALEPGPSSVGGATAVPASSVAALRPAEVQGLIQPLHRTILRDDLRPNLWGLGYYAFPCLPSLATSISEV